MIFMFIHTNNHNASGSTLNTNVGMLAAFNNGNITHVADIWL